MKLIIAKDAGYCFGVRDAVNLAYETANQDGDLYMLGHIVHNENVVKDLDDAGAKVIRKLNDVPDGKPIMFRAHGTATTVWGDAQKKDMNIIDATCPLVKEIHDEVIKLEKEGRQIIIIGDHGHDEVIGIASQVKEPIIVSTPDEANQLRKMKKVGIVSQSTQTIENVQDIINILMTKVFDLRFVNTICFPTKRNQQQLKDLSEKCDAIVVIGSFTSANSKRLTQLAEERNDRSYQVTCADDLNPEWFNDSDVVGITAGASTPDNIIEDVTAKIKSFSKNLEKELVYE
jgi:4-hydroxy-3-methylbut-2-enyl diphosphate reductase